MPGNYSKPLNIILSLVATSLVAIPINGLARTMSDDELRSNGPPALELSDVPDMQHILDAYVDDKEVAIALGKAFFWDQSVGSDGQSCASCHFHAGADSRVKNQLSPGLNANDDFFDTTRSGGGGVNYQLRRSDFGSLGVKKNFNDVVSSQGVFFEEFVDVDSSDPDDACDFSTDSVFHKGVKNTRRVEPRNTPTVINAVFNHRNFWDGRANNIFNGFGVTGKRGNKAPGAGVWKVHQGDSAASKVKIQIKNSSLASQAVGPPLSDMEMSCRGRTFPMLGRKLMGRKALKHQKVAIDDSHFSNVSSYGNLRHSSGMGLKNSYGNLIRKAFKHRWWSDDNVVEDGFTQIEANFALFYGLSLQLYEATLVSEQTPYDDFARGNNSALTNQQKRGMEVFLSECMSCHVGPVFTGATVALRALQPDGNQEGMERMTMGNNEVAVYDGGFYNIGVRGTNEDPCVGGELEGFPLSFSRQAAKGKNVDLEAREPPLGSEFPDGGPVVRNERVAVDGACKVPTLRNVDMTGPYFHNGGAASLKQVVAMYDDQFRSLFANNNSNDLDPDILQIDIPDNRRRDLVAFLRSLSDDRVRYHRAPFDHPSLKIPNGHKNGDSDNDGGRDDNIRFIRETGAGGYSSPLPNFLGFCTQLNPTHSAYSDDC